MCRSSKNKVHVETYIVRQVILVIVKYYKLGLNAMTLNVL